MKTSVAELFRIIIVAVMVLLPQVAWGRGTPEGAWQEVDGTENWRHELDISEMKPGTYNLIIRGRDFAGNEIIEGPFNIRVDPKSDLPLTRIIYPENRNIVRGNINIVGVSADDDAVTYVEVQLNDGPFERAKGSEYWRHYVDASLLKDGPQTIKVRSVDINGLVGPIYTSTFLLDTSAPTVELESHESGSIVTGRVRFSGTALDANGIASIGLSRDGGSTYEKLSFRLNRRENLYSFHFDVRTDRLEDGHYVYWLRAVDETGASHDKPFLFFVDNKGPELSIISPAPESPGHGLVQIVGSTRDKVGIQRLWYEWNREQIDIPLIAGDPYWAIEIDLRNHRGQWADVTFFALDTSGNISRVRHRIWNDQKGAQPIITLVHPETFLPVPVLGPDEDIFGYVSGVHRAQAVLVTGLGPDLQEFPANPGFRIPLADLTPGNRELRIRARDELGILGPETRIRIMRQSLAPQLVLDSLESSGQKTPFSPGIDFNRLADGTLKGRALSQSRILSVHARVVSGAPADHLAALGVLRVKTERVVGGTAFSLTLPRDGLFGPVIFEIIAKDELGAQSSTRALLHYIDTRRVAQDPGIILVDSRLDSNGLLRLSGNLPALGRVLGLSGMYEEGTVHNLRLEPANSVVSLVPSGSHFELRATAEGMVKNLFVRARTNTGVNLELGPISVQVDRTSPVITLETLGESDLPVGTTWVSLSGTVRDATDLNRLEYSLDGGLSFTLLNFKGVAGNDNLWNFSGRAEFGTAVARSYGLVIRAVDSHGNVSQIQRILNTVTSEAQPPVEGRRNDVPVLEVLFPGRTGVQVGGAQIGGLVRDLDGTAHIEIAQGSGEFRRAQTFDVRRHHQPFFIDIPNLSPGNHDFRIRATDRQGLVSGEIRVSVTVAAGPTEIFLGTGTQALTQSFRVPLGQRFDLPGQLRNADRLERLQFTINGEGATVVRPRPVAGNPLNQDFVLSLPASLPYGSHVLELQALNREGFTATRKIRFEVLSPGEPPVHSNEVLFVDSRVNGNEIRFSSLTALVGRFDGRPLTSATLRGAQGLLSIQTDPSGITLVPLRQGVANAVQIVVTTKDGLEHVSPTYRVLVDDLPPVVTLTETPTGRHYNATLPLRGQVRDDVLFQVLEYQLGSGPWQAVEVDPQGVFNRNIPLQDQKEGGLNLRLRARDDFGNVWQQWYPITYNPQPPVLEFLTPPVTDVINGMNSVIGLIQSRSPLAEVSMSLDGRTFTSLEPKEFFNTKVNFSVQELGGPGATANALPRPVLFRIRDVAGNMTEISPSVQVDFVADRPTVEIQTPTANAVITTDYVLSGMAFDDDGIDALYWRLNDEEFRRIPGGNSFSVAIPLSEMIDNGHTFEMYAVDVYGLEGPRTTRFFEVSLREPVISLNFPDVETTNKGVVNLDGTAWDENTMARVYISMDNGNTFQQVEGTDKWTYALDTTVYVDGTYSLQVVGVDRLGVEGQFFTLINIDNTEPTLEISSPSEGAIVSQILQLHGRVEDNDQIVSLTLELEPLSRVGQVRRFDLPTGRILQEAVPIQDFPEGLYNMRLTATDAAKNSVEVTRNIRIQDEVQGASVSILFPVQGSTHADHLSVEGLALSSVPVQHVQLYLNGNFYDSVEPNSRGYFKYTMTRDKLTEGENLLQVFIEATPGERIGSYVRSFNFRPQGPSVRITSHQVGDFITGRPWLQGEASFVHSWDRENREERQLIDGTTVKAVEVSFDNGRSFMEAQLRGNDAEGVQRWRFRLETQDYSNGPLSVLVRSHYMNGETAVTRTLFIVDKIVPEVNLLSPEEDSRLNTNIQLVGIAGDENGIETIQSALRSGDKAGYAVPEFIQGLYVDTHFLGLTNYTFGLGLSFFDDNVKLQANFGLGPEVDRFAGYYIGGKLLANVASIPFNAFLGPDWNFLSMSVALGANFSYIKFYEPGEDGVDGVVISGILAQIEFPRINLEDWDAFHTYSFYLEPQLWFLPSDVAPLLIPKLTFGFRVGLF